EDLTPDSFEEILGKLANGVDVAPGTCVDRVNSAPEGGAKTLVDEALYDGSRNEGSVLPHLPEPERTDAPEPEAKGEPDRKAPTNVEREEPEKKEVKAERKEDED
ncbi:MAG: NADH-quinone oxidoreductase subunit NuoE, partial [Henriciella sp.]